MIEQTQRWLVVLTIVSSIAPWSTSATAQHVARLSLHVEGMHCGACATRIEDVVGRLEGVVSAEVELERARALVTYEPSRITPARIIEAIEEAGFRVSRADRPTQAASSR